MDMNQWNGRRVNPIGQVEAQRRLYELCWRHDLMLSGVYASDNASLVLDEVRSLEDTLGVPETQRFLAIGEEPRRYRGRPEDVVRIAA